MALRSDMDIYARACSSLINFDLAQTGGISRRRGMRPIAISELDNSVLIPYTYNARSNYLVELGQDILIVRDSQGEECSRFEGGIIWQYGELIGVRWLQINALLLLFSESCPVMKLRLEEDGSWIFEPYDYKLPPWYTIDVQEHPVTLHAQSDASYQVSFDEQVRLTDREPEHGELLRICVYSAQAEAFERSTKLRRGIKIIESITPSINYSEGSKLALHSDVSCEYYICIKAFAGTDFVIGCSSPGNYPDNFLLAEDLTGFDSVTPIYGMANGQAYGKGNKIALQSGYWDHYTCIKAFDASQDYISGYNEPTHYPRHFVRGIPIGDALPCQGTWKYYCSGNWVGSYDIRRCYESEDLSGVWEELGESYSRIGSLSNNLITGDESEEACYLRLFITRSKYVGGIDLAGGWPADSCSNRLVVSSYKHSMLLRCQMVEDQPDTARYIDESPVKLPLRGSLESLDWSWQAFGVRYGYPTSATLHESRLIMASTRAQPLTIWFSAVDDLNNYRSGSGDAAGMQLTMSTNTQSPICWLASRGNVILLGTEDGEWVISDSGSSLTSSSVKIVNYGRNGSAHVPAIIASDRIIYVERGGSRIYQYSYSYESDAYQSSDLTIFADHISSAGGGVVSGSSMSKPNTKTVYVLADGSLALMTYNSMHNIHGWHRYQTEGKISSVCALPDGKRSDKLFMLTIRESIRYLELMDEDSPYYDSDGLDYKSSMITSAFSSPQNNDSKQHIAQAEYYFSEAPRADQVEVCCNEGDWSGLDRKGPLPTGWVNLVSFGSNSRQSVLGIRCHGNTPCSILALQV